ncbi:hypothetical protein THAOC_04747 [Thalassiosira oceanica]|uniref:Uncharacterized protein n=1 Tax=Thalassiosira oceanica TaxID=159749 RepID=K0T4F5_THAOC|nr:hypothetical protein THAOC_04747 [Thalassiosira oceanica]|eukprot:EJK73618.1 hypothetical protein THAOC_04747 [Thalassiosira oceanica]
MTDVGLPQTQDGSVVEAAAMDLSPAACAPDGTPPRGTDVSLMRQTIMTCGVDDMRQSITDTNNMAEILASLKGEGNTIDD